MSKRCSFPRLSNRLVISVVIAWAVATSARADEPFTAVEQSARAIPIARQVDVVVVGGTTGAVEAAVAAAEKGASVFLIAPRHYLGEDMTATLRLWLEEDEEPQTELAAKIYADPLRGQAGPDPNRLAYTYTTDVVSAKMHADTDPPSVLNDGRWGYAPTESVQYDGDVTIVADLGRPQPIAKIRLIPYWRDSSDIPQAFKIDGFEWSVGNDGKQWSDPVWVPVNQADQQPVNEQAFSITVDANAEARYVRIKVKKSEDAGRILLGELEIVGPAKAPTKPQRPVPPRPMHVKKTLDDALLDAGVPFLYACYPTDIVRDAKGRVCGVVMVNRAGRQAILAKTVIDATERAVVARLAGARFTPYPAGEHVFKRVVIGGKVREAENVTARLVEPAFPRQSVNSSLTESGSYPIIEYTLRIPVKDASWAARAEAEQIARDLTDDPEQQFSSDLLFEVPPDYMLAEEQAEGPWTSAEAVPLGAFKPQGIAGVYVLGGCAGVAREAAAKLLRPVNLTAVGRRIGAAAADEAAKRGDIERPAVAARKLDDVKQLGEIGEFLQGLRPVGEFPTIPQETSALPVLGRYDVIVVGGGTGGAPAGIAAGRQGAKTLVVEYLSTLGGVGTAGAISSYYWGNRVGFTASVLADKKVNTRWNIEEKHQWWRRELRKAGADVWIASMGCGALVDDGRVRGVVVATPFGRGVVLADVVVDSTGNVDIAAAAGAETMYTGADELAVQGTGLPPRNLGASYTNTDFTIVDETDAMDIWRVFVYAKEKYANAFDQGQLIDTRERRRIVGEFTMRFIDQVLGRAYPDTIAVSYSNFDTHGYTVDPVLELEHPEKVGFRVNEPYRMLLPKGLEGILVTGLGVSAHRDALPLIRMQADIQNQGYAAGCAAAMAAAEDIPLREIDIRKLQKHLIEIGNLPEEVLTEEDNFPPDDAQLAKAVESVRDHYHGAAVIFARPDDALPLLREAYRQEQDPEAKLIYAHILAVLGDPTGVDTLAAKVDEYTDWDQGWNYRGMGQFGSALSPLDRYIIALGRSGDPRALPVILRKLKKLSPESEFSHHRAVALALEMLGDQRAAQPLAELLSMPGMTGYVQRTIDDAKRIDAASPGGTNAVAPRRDALRELGLARALFRCGDYNGLGKRILQAYTEDLRGHFARHAKAVLESAAPRSQE
ncbi:FAD-dependent oxidoreductase [Thermostilla marina]